MKEKYYDILVIGGGAAGMAAALTAAEAGAKVLLAEHSSLPGGVLNRCIHHGFGLGYFGEDLTGQQYAARFRDRLAHSPVDVMTDTSVLRLSPDRTAFLSRSGSLQKISFRQCILAAGSYERTMESIPVSGTRPAGIFTAGCAQGLINEEHLDIGERILILGSGNVGQIMARQLVQAGKTIVAMIEQNDRPGGLPRNHRECLEAFSIPLILRSTITRILGEERICGAVVRNLDTGREQIFPCDTLITALGLIPDRSLADSLAAGGKYPDWLHLCGNCESIHDIVDSVTLAGERAGKAVIKGEI